MQQTQTVKYKVRLDDGSDLSEGRTFGDESIEQAELRAKAHNARREYDLACGMRTMARAVAIIKVTEHWHISEERIPLSAP